MSRGRTREGGQETGMRMRLARIYSTSTRHATHQPQEHNTTQHTQHTHPIHTHTLHTLTLYTPTLYTHTPYTHTREQIVSLTSPSEHFSVPIYHCGQGSNHEERSGDILMLVEELKEPCGLYGLACGVGWGGGGIGQWYRE